MVKVDFQNHWSHKSRVFQARDLAEVAYRKLGDGAVVGLVNYGDKRYEACAEISTQDTSVVRKGNCMVVTPPYADPITLLKGEEVHTSDGDLLVMGIREGVHLTTGRSLKDTCKEARDNNGIVIVTTPFFRSKVGEKMLRDPSLAELVDAIEVHNGNMLYLPNRQATDLYLGLIGQRDIGAIASSDGHSFREVGTSYTRLEIILDTTNPNFEEGVVDAIRKAARKSRLGDLHYGSNGIGALVHTGVIGSMILSDKLPKPLKRMWPISKILNRGDAQALR